VDVALGLHHAGRRRALVLAVSHSFRDGGSENPYYDQSPANRGMMRRHGQPMNETQPAIRATKLSKAFDGRTVLDAVDLEIAAGESVALVGANGAGKTTLLGCLASVLRPDGGEVRWFGHLVGRDIELRRRIGMVAHESGLYSHLSLRENLLFAARMGSISDAPHLADRWLDATGLTPHANVLPTRLSRGMRQRLAIARALIHNPPLLLLDEPFAALDAAGVEWLMTLLTDLHDRGHTICFVTHELQKMHRMAQRIIELREGRAYDITATPSERRSQKHAA
jgi:heme ABC exporter ATP-binding subunit CcmA